MEDIFIPHKLKSVEVDVEKKIFKINGESFGKGCTGFTISCKPEEFVIRMEVNTKVVFLTFDDNGEQKESRNYQTNATWFSEAANGLDE